MSGQQRYYADTDSLYAMWQLQYPYQSVTTMIISDQICNSSKKYNAI